MRLRKPCEHGRYDAHPLENSAVPYPGCPGGEFLADDATGLTAEMIHKALATPDRKWSRGTIVDAAFAYAQLLTVREGAR